ncbi:MAG: FtsX-like permease family protein [Candidatus Aminicenantes bacterium]|nr:FtsX-like permease family protein [Candidatus Aminicenantes bacterium]
MFNFLVAFRFLREGRAQTALILFGITMGIAVQVFLNSLIIGLQRSLIERTVGSAPHITASMPDIVPEASLRTEDGRPALTQVVTNEGNVKPIRDWQPVVGQLEKLGAFKTINVVARGSGFILQGEKSLPVVLQGFELDRADALYHIRRRMTAGRYEVGGNTVLIGTELAAKLRVGVGGSLRITVPSGAADIFPVGGVFDLESQPVNESWVVISLARAQTLFGLDRGVTEVELQVDDVFAAAHWARDLRASFPGLKWLSWQETNAALLAALQSQSSSSYMIQLFVLLSVTLGIASVLAVSVVQKARQIGILKAVGAMTRTVSRIFLIQGAVLGFAGSLLGSLGGWALVRLFLALRPPQAGGFPITVGFGAIVLSVAVATAAGTLAAYVPARRAARLNPIEVIRNG